jgi:hypothetical protein
MQSIRIAASAAMTLLLLGFSGLLFVPSFDMPTAGTFIGLGRGAGSNRAFHCCLCA